MVKAEGDWEALEILLSRDSPRWRDSVVFHAQQCVEKLLKADPGTPAHQPEPAAAIPPRFPP
ncbi:MAG: HEPN domain-containing protein [Cyanobacteriota bacterium]